MDKNKNKSSSSLKLKIVSKDDDKEDKDKKSDKKSEEKEEEEEKEDEFTIQQYGQNPHLLQIIKGNGYYLLNRDNYDVSKIMLLIDYQRLSMLGESFLNYESPDGEEGVLKIDFTKMVFNLLKDRIKDNEKTDLVYGLHKFFCEIDFNGDGHMEWAEFTQFIIDKVEGEFSLPEKEDEVEKKELEEKNSLKYKRYELSKNILDSNIHKKDISATAYMSNINRLFLSEYNSNKIKIYNPLTGRIENILDVLKINYTIEREKVEEIIRGQKMEENNNKILNKTQKNLISPKTDSLTKLLGQNYLKKKMQEQKSFNKSISIVNLTTFNSVIAVILSNNLIQFFTTVSNGNGELIFQIKTKSLQKRIWHLKEHNIWFSTGDKEPREKYFYLNELDIDFEFRAGAPFPISNNLSYRRKISNICKHKNEIYDIIEIKKPSLILTACLDGLIRLIDYNDDEFYKSWSYHNLGVRHLDYNPNLDLNGYIVSTGFEIYINIFSTDLSLDEAYKGRLEGHFVPVINCKFLGNSPNCVSVDEEGNVRIWDIILRTCLQSIPIMKKNFTASGLLFMERINKFIVFGKIMLFFDSKYKEIVSKIDASEDMEEVNYPIKISFNTYYQHFYVTTLKDIRIYNKNGELEKTFKKCIENENFEPGVKIKNFIFEEHMRKFYLSFSNGAIMQYNAGNGSLIKPINQYDIEKDGILYYKYTHTKDVNSLFFFDQERESEKDNLLLVSASLDSTIQVFNEYELETTTKLRTLKGGHTIGEKKCEIYCLDFSPNLCQFATGGSDGLISVWDFEFSKIQNILYFNYKIWGVKLDVICLKYLNDYPLLFSSYSDGICALWGIYPLDKTPLLILKFHNFYQGLMKLDFCDVLCCHFYEGAFQDIQPKFINKIYFVDTPENIKERNKKRIDPITKEVLPLIDREDIEKDSIIDESIDPILFEEMLHNQYDQETLQRVMKENPRDYEKKVLTLCDKKGFIRLLDLTGIFGKYKSKLSHPENFHVLGSNFNLLKKDDINAESFLSHAMHSTIEQQKMYYNQSYNNLYATNIIKTEWRGHLDAITSIEYIKDPICLITVAADMHLRVWDERLELIGEIDIFQREKHKFVKKELAPWKFKVNEKAILEQEINEIMEAVEEVGIKPIEFGSKEDIEMSKYKIVKEEKKQIKIEKKEEDIVVKKKKKEKEEDKQKNEHKDLYENLLLKTIVGNIDQLFQNKLSNEGFGEMSRKLIDAIINHKEREKELEEKIEKAKQERKGVLLTSTLRNNMTNDMTKSKNSSLISNQEKDKEADIKSENIELDKKKKEKIKVFKSKFGNTFTPGKLSNILLNFNKLENNMKESSKFNSKHSSELNMNINNEINIEDNTFRKKNIRLSSSLRSKIVKENRDNNKVKSVPKSIFNKMYRSNSSSIFSARQKKLKRNISAGYIQINGFGNASKINMRPKTGKVNHVLALKHIPNNVNRSTLYSKKLFLNSSTLLSQTKSRFFPSLKEKLAEVNKNNSLNYNMKEKTEDLVRTQFYLNSYKNCCKIIPNNCLSTNTSIMLNYKNLWNNVKSYTNSIVSKKTIPESGFLTKRKKMARNRSVSSLIRKH